MYFKSFIVSKIDKIKSVEMNQCDLCHIDVNMWFKTNSLTPSDMNEIRQFIFEEWFYKKLTGSKNKILSGSNLVIIYDSPNDLFVELLKNKISDIFECGICEVVLIDE